MQNFRGGRGRCSFLVRKIGLSEEIVSTNVWFHFQSIEIIPKKPIGGVADVYLPSKKNLAISGRGRRLVSFSIY